MSKKIIGFTIALICFLSASCGLANKEDHLLTVTNLKGEQQFTLEPPATTHKATVKLISDVTDIFSLTIDNGHLFKGEYDSLGLKQMESIYKGDWYQNPMFIKYIGSKEVSGEVKFKVRFYY